MKNISLSFGQDGKELHSATVSLNGRLLSEALAEAKQTSYLFLKQFAETANLKATDGTCHFNNMTI